MSAPRPRLLPGGQSRRHSALEACANIAAGMGVSVAANMLILPSYGCAPGFLPALEIGLIFTAISFIRSYVFRRLFNLWTLRSGAPHENP